MFSTAFNVSGNGLGHARQRCIVFATILSVAIGLMAGCHSDPNVAKQKYLESGKKYSAEQKYRQAAIQYSNALKIDKNFADAHFALASAYMHMGMPLGAYNELERTVELQPTNYAARIELGKLLVAGGRLDDAQAQAKAVLAAQPNNPDVHGLLSALAWRRGDRATALKEVNTAIQLAPSRPIFHENLALLEANDPSQSALVESELQKAIALDPKDVEPRLLLAEFYAKSKRWPDAEKTSEAAIGAAPKSVQARKSLALIYFEEGNQAAGEQVLRQAAQDLASDPQGVSILANYYVGTGQLAKAKAEYARLTSEHPSDLVLQEGYIRVLLQDNDIATAQNLISALMKKHGKDPQVIALNAIVLIQNGKAKDAETAMQGAIRDAPQDAFLQFWLGKAALANGDSDLAEKSFLEAERLDPSALIAEQELAQLASQRGDFGLLSSVSNRMVTAAKANSSGYVWRAIAEAHYNQLDKADADLNEAIRLAPQDPRPYIELARVRFAQNKFPEGASLLEKALQCDPDSVPALRLLVSYDLYAKKPAEALARTQAQVNLRPKNSGFDDILAQLQLSGNHPDLAAATAQKAIGLNSGDSEAMVLYAQAEVGLGQTANAINLWQKWVQAHPQDADAVALLGTLEEGNGNVSAAESDYQKALNLQSTQALAANNLAYLMLEHGGNADVALTLAQIARQKLPESPETADTLAWAYYYKGIYAFARDLLEQATKAEPNNPEMHYHLGMVYSKMRNKSDAQAQLRKAIALDPKSPTAGLARNALQGLI